MTGSVRDDVRMRRDKAVAMAMKRKEEYLGARVPKELRDQVIQKANDMGVPVSILIRRILEDAFKDVGGVLKSSTAFDSALPKVIPFESVLGWDRIVLNKSVPCTNCGVQLAAGVEVTLGLGAPVPVVLCDRCKGANG